MFRKLLFLSALLLIAAAIDGAVFAALAPYVHSVGPLSAWILTIVSFTILPPLVLGFFFGDAPPALLHTGILLAEVAYLWGLFTLVRRIRGELNSMAIERPSTEF